VAAPGRTDAFQSASRLQLRNLLEYRAFAYAKRLAQGFGAYHGILSYQFDDLDLCFR